MSSEQCFVCEEWLTHYNKQKCDAIKQNESELEKSKNSKQ